MTWRTLHSPVSLFPHRIRRTAANESRLRPWQTLHLVACRQLLHCFMAIRRRVCPNPQLTSSRVSNPYPS